jgi:hypothetical protein
VTISPRSDSGCGSMKSVVAPRAGANSLQLLFTGETRGPPNKAAFSSSLVLELGTQISVLDLRFAQRQPMVSAQCRCSKSAH